MEVKFHRTTATKAVLGNDKNANRGLCESGKTKENLFWLSVRAKRSLNILILTILDQVPATNWSLSLRFTKLGDSVRVQINHRWRPIERNPTIKIDQQGSSRGQVCKSLCWCCSWSWSWGGRSVSTWRVKKEDIFMTRTRWIRTICACGLSTLNSSNYGWSFSQDSPLTTSVASPVGYTGYRSCSSTWLLLSVHSMFHPRPSFLHSLLS